MKAVLGQPYSIDLLGGPPNVPENPRDCWVWVTAEIGHEGAPGSDNFEFVVATPKSLDDMVANDQYFVGRNLIVVNKFDWDVVRSSIQYICDQAFGDTWEEVAQIISRYGHWEYEEFQG